MLDLNENKIIINSKNPEYKIFYDHFIDDRIILPSFGYIFILWKILAKNKNVDYLDLPIEFTDIKFIQEVVLKK